MEDPVPHSTEFSGELENLREDVRPVRLSLQLIVKRHLPADANTWSQDKMVESLNKITHLRLDRENIGHIDSLELLGSNVTNVYLQENRITEIQNLECLHNLQFLALSGNRISKVENLRQLKKLIFLDLSDNRIDHLDVDELPTSVIILNLKGNPCCDRPGYRQSIVEHLPKLKQLDLEELDEDDSDEEDEAGAAGSAMKKVDLWSGDDEFSMDPRATATADVLRSGKSKLPSIDSPLDDVMSEMLMRSQNRLEENLQLHLYHKIEMDKVRMSQQ